MQACPAPAVFVCSVLRNSRRRRCGRAIARGAGHPERVLLGNLDRHASDVAVREPQVEDRDLSRLEVIDNLGECLDRVDRAEIDLLDDRAVEVRERAAVTGAQDDDAVCMSGGES